MTLVAGGVRSQERAAGGLLDRIRHEELAVRTIRVSFAAAVTRVEQHPAAAAEEVRELVEGWRGWALAALRAHADEVRAARRDAPADAADVYRLADALRRFDKELREADRIVSG